MSGPTVTLIVRDINPVQWKEPSPYVFYKGGKARVGSKKNEAMEAFQNALKEDVRAACPNLVPFPRDVELVAHFYFWRQLEEYASPGSGRNTRLRAADRTNLVKSTEDALQGVLYVNDVQIKHGIGSIVDQAPDTEPMIMVVCGPKEHYESVIGGELAAGVIARAHPLGVDRNVWLEVGK